MPVASPPAQVAGPNGAPAPGAAALALVPFTRASMEHTEPGNLDVTLAALGAASVQINAVDIPAYGYLRYYDLLVEATGGTGTAAIYAADAPWSAIQEVTLSDINGAPIYGPVSGYDLFLTQLFGGYSFMTDPQLSPEFVTPATSGNYSFLLRIPLEIDVRDALGSVANMNAGANYQLRITAAASTAVYTTPPTGAPTVRFRGWIEAWAQPAAQSIEGFPQAVQPPALGTTQYWSRFIPPVAAGQQTIQLRRVGNYLRMLVLVMRNAAGARVASLPDPIQIYWDSRLVFNEALALRRRFMWERYNVTIPTGVIVFDMAHDFSGHVGQEMRDQWWRTVQSSRIEIQGAFGVAGTLELLTNDVAPDGSIYY